MSTRRPLAALALALLVAAALSGCTIRPYVRVIGAAPQVSVSVAGAYYLDVICPRNAAIYRYDAVHASHDLATLHRVAAVASAASRTAAAGLRAGHAPWPEGVRADVELLAESLDLDARSYDALATARTLHAAWSVQWPGDTSAGDAKFRIRRAVGLSDGRSYDDCVGHYEDAPASSADATV